jgi:teichuronic acid biosynthesis glycosyltransferase TuaG
MVASNRGRISIIMPAYNAVQYIKEAIQSVVDQTYQDWELLVINDGSTDQTLEVIQQFDDERILVYTQEKNQGVSAARNVGLEQAKGEFICFLDADDVFPPNSLQSRLNVFLQNPNISFVDGKVEFRKGSLFQITKTYMPQLADTNPLEDLVKLSGKCFVGQTWMIRNKANLPRFSKNMTHGEDLLFYVECALKGGLYSYTDEVVLYYRQSANSAMRNIDGLAQGYRTIGKFICKIKSIDQQLLKNYHRKSKSIIFKSYLKVGQPLKALKSLFN